MKKNLAVHRIVNFDLSGLQKKSNYKDNTMTGTFLLLTVMMGLFLLVGYLLGRKRGMYIAFAIALVMNMVTYWYSDSMVLSYYKAEPVSESHRLYRITEQVSREAGIPMPRVFRIPSEAANAFATGRSPSHAAVAATDGILRILSDDELKGVMSHELGHVVNRDTLISTIAASMAGAVMMLSRFALWFGGSKEKKGNALVTIVVALVAPIAATMIQLAISRNREYEADKYGGTLTRKPLYLASALQKLQQSAERKPVENARPETAHLFIVNPFSSAFSLRNAFSTHPPMQNRVARLKQLDKALNR